MKENFVERGDIDNLLHPEENPSLLLDTGGTWIPSVGDLL